MNMANAKYIKSFVEVYPNFPSHVTKIAPKTRGWSKFYEIYFILLKIPPVVILSDSEKMLKVWRESADLDPWTLPGP